MQKDAWHSACIHSRAMAHLPLSNCFVPYCCPTWPGCGSVQYLQHHSNTLHGPDRACRICSNPVACCGHACQRLHESQLQARYASCTAAPACSSFAHPPAPGAGEAAVPCFVAPDTQHSLCLAGQAGFRMPAAVTMASLVVDAEGQASAVLLRDVRAAESQRTSVCVPLALASCARCVPALDRAAAMGC